MKQMIFLQWSVCVALTVLLSVSGYAQKNIQGSSIPIVRDGITDSSRALVYVKDTTRFLNWMRINLSHAEIVRTNNSSLFNLLKLKDADHQRLRQERSVRAINVRRKAFPEREIGGVDLTLNAITSVHGEYPELDGSGLIVSVKEDAFDKNDIDFYNRVFQSDAISSEPSLHATIMATIVAGAGNSSPEGRGVAKNALIAFADFEDLNPANTDQLRDDGITVQNHSYGVGIENEYGIESHLFDKQSFEYPELVHVFSAGNNGNEASTFGPYANVPGYANITGQFKMSKNTVSVGSTNMRGEVATLSSRGPAHDGRIKPEVVAHGDQGSSEAAAIVSGISLLLQQEYRDGNAGVLPPSSLIRATLVNSADDNGRPQVDYEYGFGDVDALGSIETVRDERYFLDVVGDEETKTFVINLPSNSRDLKVTLAWTDKEAEPGAEKAIVNDLDLELYQVSSNTTFAPWSLSTYPHVDSLKKNAVRKADHLNTIEQITIPGATSGEYHIRVKGFNVSTSQSFSVVYELVDEFRWTYPMASDVLVADETKLLRWKWNGSTVMGNIQWRVQGDMDWESISEVGMNDECFSWTVPSINDVIELRLSWGAGEFITDPVRVSNVLLPSIGYYCDPDGLSFWNNDGSDSYNIYVLGEKFLESSSNGVDTIYYKTEEAPPFMSVASVVKGKEGRRSRLVDFRSGVCYITSFLPDQVVTDSVTLFLSLGTNIGVKSFDLERLTSQGAVAVQSIDPVNATQFVLDDPSPLPGSNRYQIRLTREDGGQVLSQVEEVFFVNEDDLQFFPNPVTAGDPITVVMNAEASEFWIQDMLGKSVNASYDDAELKTIETSALVPGVYIIKSVSSTGRVLTGRIVIK
jgi:hypothetical protein